MKGTLGAWSSTRELAREIPSVLIRYTVINEYCVGPYPLNQAQQFDYLDSVLPDAGYPRVLRRWETGFEMSYEQGSTLAEILDGDDAAADPSAALIESIDALFERSMRFNNLGRRETNSFLENECVRRIRRIESALSQSLINADGEKIEHVKLRRQLSSAIPLIAAIAEHLGGSARLTLAVHGDFVPTNVIIGRSIAFVDVRSHWQQGTPVWDPIMDLASFSVFCEHIWPALRAEGLDTPMLRKMQRGAVVEHAHASQAARSWMRHDPLWRERFYAYEALRVAGNCANHLLTTRTNGIRSVNAVAPILLSSLQNALKYLIMEQ